MLIYSAFITALSVAVPLIVVSIALWHLSWSRQAPALLMAGAIPLFIAFPISVFALNLLRCMNSVVTKVDQMVRLDGLTGLINRTHFYHLLETHRKEKALFAIIDADHFKRINDNYGHDAGDEALVLLSQHLSGVFGSYGLVARLGGEEFGIYLRDISLDQFKLLFALLRTKLRTDQLHYDDEIVAISVSIGLAVDDLQCPFKTMSKHADECLYAAKKAGRDCCFVKNEVDEMLLLAA